MVGLRRPGAVARDRRLAERTQAAAHVAQHVFTRAGLDLDARGVAAIRSGDGEVEAVEIGVEFGVVAEVTS